jgi:hypothetical protein
MMLACGCPGDYPDWDGQDLDLGGQLVHRLPIPMLMHMPLAYELYVKRQQQAVEHLGLKEKWPGLLFVRTGFLRGSITRLLENVRSPARNIHVLSRPFWVRAVLHHGNISTGRKVIQGMQMALVDAGRRPKELYFSYLTCPHCGADRGGEKMLFLRRWEESAVLKSRLDRRRETAK